MKKFNLGVGPMSTEIVELCLEYSATHDYPIMIIASRNQVDHDTGYAMTTAELSKLVKSNPHYNKERVLLCRDHCGPYFGDRDKGLRLEQAIAQCKDTIRADAAADFDLIHIDVSRVGKENQAAVATQLFTTAVTENKHLMFEFGTEDNTGNTTDTIRSLTEQVQWVEEWRDNIKFIVSQTGSLIKQSQIGSFDVDQNRAIADLIHSYGYLFKEHNADYIERDQVALRARAGVDAINIAPQLGAICSGVLYDLGRNSVEFQKFANTVLDSGYWKRWCTPDVDSDRVKFIASAHYLYKHEDCQKLLSSLNRSTYYAELKSRTYAALDEYRIGYKS